MKLLNLDKWMDNELTSVTAFLYHLRQNISLAHLFLFTDFYLLHFEIFTNFGVNPLQVLQNFSIYIFFIKKFKLYNAFFKEILLGITHFF